MPSAPSPDDLKSETEIARALAHAAAAGKEKFLCDKPLEIRPVEFHNPMKGHTAEPARRVDPRQRQRTRRFTRASVPAGVCVGFQLPASCATAARCGLPRKGMQVATIDHSMWFHRPFDMNEWLLYSVESTSASSARGFVRGEFYTRMVCWWLLPCRKV